MSQRKKKKTEKRELKRGREDYSKKKKRGKERFKKDEKITKKITKDQIKKRRKRIKSWVKEIKHKEDVPKAIPINCYSRILFSNPNKIP